ncbi:interleukin-1 receptor-like 1 isoform X2 [Brachyhypopomus gauderio]
MTGLLMISACFLAELVMTSPFTNSTVQCELQDTYQEVMAVTGEGLYLPCPNLKCSSELNASLISWFKNNSNGIQQIPVEETSRVHHHGAVLYILPLAINDTGRYITRWWYEHDKCDEYETDVVVYGEFHTDQLYRNFSEQTATVEMLCPVCENQEKNLTWYKDFHLIPGQTEEILRVRHTSKKDDGIYTCVCSWEHHGHTYKSSGSHQLQIVEPARSYPPRILSPPNNSIEFTDLGAELVLKCSVFFGTNVKDQLTILWVRNDTRLVGVKGYSYYTRKVNGTVVSVLTIRKVSKLDLHSVFRCLALDSRKWVQVFITLRSRESALPLVVMFLCLFLLFLLTVGITKWFTVDLVLFFRNFWVVWNKRDDGKVYDAYVVYQKDKMDEETEIILANFIGTVLPAVLEDKCGFKLFIQGRDDLPGEDCLVLTDARIQLSRRLIVVLTPGVCQGQKVMTPQDYAWHVGLHQVLVQQEMRAILIQLGGMSENSELPQGLQHLLWKTPLLRWDRGSPHAAQPASRFWKQVRYMMPVPAGPACQPRPRPPSPNFSQA